jgi:RNA polymerase sigma-70 factor (ECF subfamily)
MNPSSQLDGCSQVDKMELKPRASDVLNDPTIEAGQDWRSVMANTHSATDVPRHDQNGDGPSTLRGDEATFNAYIEPFRRELRVHCYRLLGSLQDAEDVVQETLLRAWQRIDSFQGRSSLRAWLYRIAINACLDTLRKRPPRGLPEWKSPALSPNSGIAPASAEPIWLEPFPDRWLAEERDNPEARYSIRESVTFAFLTVLQVLPPRQRVVLLLSDVLDWRASEVAHLLSTSISAVKSALRRARVTLSQTYHPNEPERVQALSIDSATSDLLSRYVTAWETDDIVGLVALLKEDATMSMPPSPSWLYGRDAIGAFWAATAFHGKGRLRWRLVATGANMRPAFAVYLSAEPDAAFRAFGLQIITADWQASNSKITGVTTFTVPSLFPYFDLPLELPH